MVNPKNKSKASKSNETNTLIGFVANLIRPDEVLNAEEPQEGFTKTSSDTAPASEGKCPKCGRTISLYNDGRLYRHQNNEGEVCEMSGKTPS